MSDKIKIFFMYPEVQDVETAIRWMRLQDLPFSKNFVWDKENPDYLIASERIFFNPDYAKLFKKLAYGGKNKPILIFFVGEAVTPDFNIFDYAVAWNRNMSYMDRYSMHAPYILNDQAITQSEAKSLLKNKKRFCNFLYSNKHAHPNRDKLFDLISAYKRVDSLGPHMNNVGTLISVGGGGDW